MTSSRQGRTPGLRRGPHQPLRILMIGDVGGPTGFHVGDEAMLEANIARLRRWCSDAIITVISDDPSFTAQRYAVAAIKPIAFASAAHADAERQERLTHCRRVAQIVAQGGQPPQDNLGQVVAALAQADALLVSGGGNLSSTWPHLLYERAALLTLADILGIPSILTGQTVGPNLTASDRDVLAQTLPLAQLVGVREEPSAHLAHGLGVPWSRILYQLDDCFDLPAHPISDTTVLDQLDIGRRPLVLVTIHPFARGDACQALAHQLDDFAAVSGAHLAFVPHVAGTHNDQPPGDLVMGQQIKSCMRPNTPFTLLGIRGGSELLWLTSQAQMVISTRYHPLVFAMRTGVPALGIYTDDYTRTKLRGALQHAGLEQWTLPMDVALGGALLPAAGELWQRRNEVRQHVASKRPLWQGMQEHLERRVTAALGIRPSTQTGDQVPLLSALGAQLREGLLAPNGAWQDEVALADGPSRRFQDEAGLRVFAHEQAAVEMEMVLAETRRAVRA